MTATLLSACTSTENLASYDVDGIVEINYNNIDEFCENDDLVDLGSEMLRCCADNILMSIVVDSSIEITKDELGEYDHLVVTNIAFIKQFGDVEKLEPVSYDSLPQGMQQFLDLQMPLWTEDNSVLPDGVSLYQYTGDSLLAFPFITSDVGAIEAKNPLLLVADDPVDVFDAKAFLLPMSSSTNLIFRNEDQVQNAVDKFNLNKYIKSIDYIKISR